MASTTAGFEWRANAAVADTTKGWLFTTSPQKNGVTAKPQLTLLSTEDTPTPQAFGTIHACSGDDLSPPNAVPNAGFMNGIAVPVSSSGGWSGTPPRQSIYPSGIDYHIRVQTDDSLELGVQLEYTNNTLAASQQQSMMVRVKIAKSMLYAQQELALVSTKFQELVQPNNWVDITADVDYTQVADAVVHAVLADPDAGQMAGKATISAETVDVTLGPFLKRGRLLLTFKSATMYSYQAMSIMEDGNDIGSHRLLPLMVALPFAAMDREAGMASLSVTLSAPKGTVLLPTEKAKDAYMHLKKQRLVEGVTIIAVSDLLPQEEQDTLGYTLRWDSLPPRSCGVLTWMALPNPPVDDFVDVANELGSLKIGERIDAVVQVPTAQDITSLQVPLPGHGPVGNLFRIKVSMPKAQARKHPCFLLNLTISDKSGSTGIRTPTGETVRQRFNEMAEMRFLKRLDSIPALVQAGVLQQDDVWMDAFLAFDHSAPKNSISRVAFRIGDVVNGISSLVTAIRAMTICTTGAHPLEAAIMKHVLTLRGVTPGGATDFSVGPRTIVEEYPEWLMEAKSLTSTDPVPCTFVEFDTDGGHNSADYLESLQDLVNVCHVRNGVVAGFGAWLNQDCASKVAVSLGSVPAQLALQVPRLGAEGMNVIFRRCFSAWITALRQPPPVALTVSAGAVTFPASSALTRTANAVEVLAFRCLGKRQQRVASKFGSPDVTNESFTATVLEGLPAGEQLILYVTSRLESAAKLSQALKLTANEQQAHVSMATESFAGDFLAYDWMNVLTSDKSDEQLLVSPLLASSLRTRIEDEVSFRFNIASPSGKTSYLGRCKTAANRAAIDSAHQPAPPANPLSFVVERRAPASHGDPFGAPAGGLFGALAPTGFFGAPAPAGLFEAPAPGATRGRLFGAPTPATSGGLFGAPALAFGAPAPAGSFGAPIPAPSGGLFGAPVPATNGHLFGTAPAFGAPIPVPAGSFGARVPATSGGSFGAPTPATSGGLFGAPVFASPAPRVCYIADQEDIPLWARALSTQAGSSVKDDFNLKEALAEVYLTWQRLAEAEGIAYFCDVCRVSMVPGQERFHCLDCDDFDACASCQNMHKHTHPMHLMQNVSRVSTNSTTTEDPLVKNLLKTTMAEPSSPPLRTDRTLELSTLRLRRLLRCTVAWWPLLRSMFCRPDRLPTSIPDELSQKIASCTAATGSLQELLEVSKVVIDSFLREETTAV